MTTRLQTVGAWLCLAALAPVLLTGCGGGSAKGYATPEEAAAAAKSAVEKKDMGALYDTLSNESQDVLAGGMVLVGSMMKLFSGMAAMGGPEAVAEAEKELGAVTAIMEEYGVTDEAMQALPKPPGPEAMSDPAAVKALGDIVKDKRAFVVAMLTALEKSGKGGPNLKDKFSGELKDLKIDGDKATAMIVGANGDEEIDFRKTADGWKLHIDMEKIAAQGGPPAGDMPSMDFPPMEKDDDDAADGDTLEPAADPFGDAPVESEAEPAEAP